MDEDDGIFKLQQPRIRILVMFLMLSSVRPRLHKTGSLRPSLYIQRKVREHLIFLNPRECMVGDDEAILRTC